MGIEAAIGLLGAVDVTGLARGEDAMRRVAAECDVRMPGGTPFRALGSPFPIWLGFPLAYPFAVPLACPLG